MAKIRETTVAVCDKKFLLKGLSSNVRLDGRSFDEFRDVKLEFGKDWGCCYVSLGHTCALAQVSCEVQQPNSSRPSEGMLNINVELSPMAAANFEAGRQTDTSVQMNRLLEKCIKDSKAVDLEALCIKVNEKVWCFRVDINILNNEGNILDCASIAALSALAHFRRPDVTSDGEEIIIHTYAERDPVPTVLHHHPVCVSYAVFNQGEILADPTLREESCADAQLNIGLNAYKELCTLHLGGSSIMDQRTVIQYTEKAAKRASEVINVIKKTLEEDTAKRERNEPVDFSQSLFSNIITDTSEILRSSLDPWITSKSKIKEISAIDLEVKGDTEMEVVSQNAVALLPQEKEESKTKEISVIDLEVQGDSEVEVISQNAVALLPQEEEESKTKEISVIDLEVQGDSEVEVISQNAVALLPQEKEESVWICSDEDDDCILVDN